MLPSGYYDLVLLIHSIFAFENGQAIMKVMELRNPEGKVVVVSNASDSFLGGLKRLVDNEYNDKRYELDDLQRSLQEQNIHYQSYEFSTNWAISRIDYDRDLRVILDWISLGQFSSFSEVKQRGIFSYVSEVSEEDGDRILFMEKEIVLIIPDCE